MCFCQQCQVDGLVISNTTTERNHDLKGEYIHELGGLSGEPLANVATEFISEMYKLTEGMLATYCCNPKVTKL